ncbi:MAG: TIGR02300 family protein [Rhizobiaceae bacterium]|nr:TIGR02300 family protein [Rhizobiaceae bacterium]
MAKANLGTKRVCPETGRKFYDLEKDPIVSPYTGKEYEISFFEGEATITAPKPDEAETPTEVKAAETTDSDDDDTILDTEDDGPEIISLDDAEDDADDDSDDEDIPDIPDIPDVDVDDDDDASDDDTFLEDDDENDDLSDVIVGVEGDDDES